MVEAVDWIREGCLERVVVFFEGGLCVMQHQAFEAGVDIVGLGESKTTLRFVDEAVAHFAVSAGRDIGELVVLRSEL